MKRIIKLTESDLARIVKRVISEQDEVWGQSDRGEEELQDLIEEARDILENECGYDIEEINSMDERDIVEFLSDEGYEDLAVEIEHLLDQEGFDDLDDMPSYKTKWSMPKDSEEELGEGHDDFIMKRRYKDYDSSDYRRIPKDAVRPGKIDFEGTMLSASDDDDDFDEWSLGDDDEEYV